MADVKYDTDYFFEKAKRFFREKCVEPTHIFLSPKAKRDIFEENMFNREAIAHHKNFLGMEIVDVVDDKHNGVGYIIK